MSTEMPRAPKLQRGTCIATGALIESAQRVFFYHSSSPIHWIDLCTVFEAIILHDKIAFPVLYWDYAEPLVKPLMNAGLIDPWWPEAGLVNGPLLGTKEDVWREKDGNLGEASQAISILSGGWPDAHFDSLSDARKTAIDGIAHGFAEPALSSDDDRTPLLLWGTKARNTAGPRYESVAASCLQEGVAKLQTTSPVERAAFRVPHVDHQDVYNHYAKHLRDLANDANAILIKSVIEEPYFDTVSLETAASETLHAILKDSYEKNIVKEINKYARIVPASPLAGIALSKANSIAEAVTIAIDLRATFKSYRELMATYRKLQLEAASSQTLLSSKEVTKIEYSFRQALEYSMRRMNTDLEVGPKYVFDGLEGIRKIAVNISSKDYKSIIDAISYKIVDLVKGWYYMSYGGIFELVNQFPKLRQLGANSQRLTGKELDTNISEIVAHAAKTIKRNYGLTGVGDGVQ